MGLRAATPIFTAQKVSGFLHQRFNCLPRRLAVDVHVIMFSARRRSKAQRPPKNRLNELNTRPGKLSAFCGPFGARCAKGHCEPPCTWHAPVGILSTGKSMS